MGNETVVLAFKKERLQWFKFVILEPCDYGNQFYLEKLLKIVQCYVAPLDGKYFKKVF